MFGRNLAVGVIGLLCWSALGAGDPARSGNFDWPQWQGPDRTAVSRETGLLASWPRGGPRLLWEVKDAGGGYSTPSVAAGRVYGMSFWKEDEIVWCRDASSGKEIWYTAIAPANRSIGYGDGPRCTPTVVGNRLYALGVSGDLVCLDTDQGKEQWHRQLVKECGGRVPPWGYSESPLVDGDRVIATPGGSKATLAAFATKNGETIWNGVVPEGDGAGYSSAIIAQVDGEKQYVQFLAGGVVGVAAADGSFRWRYNHPANGTANISTAIFHGGRVFAASGYGTGGGEVELTRHGSETSAKEVFFTRHMQNQHGGVVLVDGYLYGSNEGQLACLDFLTGEVQWEERRPGKGSIAYADGHLYYRNEQGPMILVEANPKKYVERGRFTPPNPSGKSTWPHPVIANGNLYLRDQDVLQCYDLHRP